MGTASPLLGPPGTALHCMAGVQHLVSKHSNAVPLQEKVPAACKGELHASLRAREARAQRAAFFEDAVSDLQHAAACDVLRRHRGVVSTKG